VYVKLTEERRKIFVRRLRKAYSAAGFTSSSDFADAVGVSKSTAAGWLNGTREPSTQKMVDICELLDVSANWLLGIED
jgi:transcriptional regulator with XRE-family HTH domain